MNRSFVENIIKNILILLILIPAYFQIQSFIATAYFVTDKSTIGSFLVAVSILAVTACFGNFAFTYEKIDHRNGASRILAHLTIGLLMLLIGLSLEMTMVFSRLLVGTFFIFDLSLVILYTASVLYDFWDLNRANIK